MTTPYPDHPQLTGNFAPIRMECDLDDVIVRGDLPAELDITYYRNGPDPQFPPRGDHHWFAGDGMLHMFRIRGGRVRYRNRWARTAKWTLERREGRSLFNPFNPMDTDPVAEGVETDGLANTNVVWHGAGCWPSRKATRRSNSTRRRSTRRASGSLTNASKAR